MAPAQMDQGYTHKKFNCGYPHKKLGRRFRQRMQEYNENMNQQQIEQMKSSESSSKTLFRPYALDENNTPRKRKIKHENDTIPENLSQVPPTVCHLQNQQQHQQTTLNIDNNISYPTVITTIHSTDPSSLSPNSYNIRLQRQRAALYMRYLAQIQQQQQNYAPTLQTANGYPMGYPNVTAPIFNGC